MANNPKYGNLSRKFHICLTAWGEGSTQAVSLTPFPSFLTLPLLRGALIIVKKIMGTLTLIPHLGTPCK